MKYRIVRHVAAVLVISAVCIAGETHGGAAPAAASGEPSRTASQAYADGTVRLHALAPVLALLARNTEGLVSVSVGDITSGHAISVNGGRSLPAASTIKIPVMVEVFRQVAIGRFELSRAVDIEDADRDCGHGSLCDAPWGARYTVADLLARMIDESDNTATNMLIRLVGLRNINDSMAGLGLAQTHLGDRIRSDGDIRTLRTSADDMRALLTMIAQRRVVDAGSSEKMMALLAAQRNNTLLPEPLPKGLVIAHKTGTLDDTLNDVGVVELAGAPYVICAFSTHLADLDDGERFIRRASLLTYWTFKRTAHARIVSNARL